MRFAAVISTLHACFAGARLSAHLDFADSGAKLQPIPHTLLDLAVEHPDDYFGCVMNSNNLECNPSEQVAHCKKLLENPHVWPDVTFGVVRTNDTLLLCY